jgi:alcohol dehydrogenase
MKTRAAVLRAVGADQPYAGSRPLGIEELELAPPGDGEVLVGVRAAGLCHSDLSVVNGSRPRPVPMALGHEAAGEVLEVGRGVTTVVPGDHVVMVFVPSCGACGPCQEGRPALCEPGAVANTAGTLLRGERRLTDADGAPVHHHLGCSAFAEHAVVSERSLVKIDRDLPWAQAALFGCAVLTGVGAVVNTAQVRLGQSVAVVGLGGVGLNALLAAVHSGARQVVAVDLHDDKLELARRLGATHTVRAGADAAAEVRDLTEGGVDVAVELAGSVPAWETAYRATRRGGTTVTGGLPHPDAQWTVPPVHLVAEERTIKGSYIGSAVPARDIPRYVGLFRAGRLPVDALLGEQVALDDINVAFDHLESGHALRQVVVTGD